MKVFHWKFAIVVVVILTAVVCILPNINSSFWPHNKINLGLDLQGGMHVVLSVDTDKTIESSLRQLGNEVRTFMNKKQINILNKESSETKKIRILIKNKENINKFISLLENNFPDLKLIIHGTNEDREIFLRFTSDRENEIKKMSLEQALETIRNRIDQFGVSEPDIRLQGSQHILVQLPGIKDPERAKDLIGRTAILEFKIVNSIIHSENISNRAIPPGNILIYGKDVNKNTGVKSGEAFLVNREAFLTGAHIRDAKVCIDSNDNNPYVMIKFSKIGANIFEQLTSENVNKRLAVILDGSVYSTPVINERISGGQAIITGRFTMEDAKDLAIVLRAGALPAPVEVVEERTVGPSLGMDSIRNGLISIFVATLMVTFFMMIYYKISGLIANLALIINILIILAGLAIFDATLTLPGIAGVILTIGIAVDSNVLIFERIREEAGLGRSPLASVTAGYRRATLTILDSNVTTLIAALVLFQFGTGPIKGFAVTLILGIIASLFTSLIFTRIVFDYFFIYRNIKNISI